MPSESLDSIFEKLNYKSNWGDVGKAFTKESINNFWPEGKCIAACEAGDLLTIGAAWEAGVVDKTVLSLMGFGGGLLAGVYYAMRHVRKHAQKHGSRVSFSEVFDYVVSSELGCVIGAAGVETLFGLATNNNSPYDPENLKLRLLYGLPAAFVVGLGIMNGFSQFHNREAGRLLARQESLDLVYDGIIRDLVGGDVKLRKGKLILNGENNYLAVKEKKVPKTLENQAEEGDSLYVVQSSVCRYVPEWREQMTQDTIQLFENVGVRTKKVENIFRH